MVHVFPICLKDSFCWNWYHLRKSSSSNHAAAFEAVLAHKKAESANPLLVLAVREVSFIVAFEANEKCRQRSWSGKQTPTTRISSG